MKKYECKCGSKEIFIKDSGNNKGLYCADCGKWMQWLSKDELRLAERQIEQQNMCESCIHKVSADDIKAIRNSAIDECIAIVNFHKNEYDGICWAIRELEELKEKINELPNNTND